MYPHPNLSAANPPAVIPTPDRDLRSPAAGYVRTIGPADLEAVRDHLLRLDPETRRLRFGNAVNDRFLRHYADALIGPMSHVKGIFIEGVLRGLGELRFLADDHAEAEGAFSIEPGFQELGHGKRLFARLVLHARTHGIKRLYITCLRENRRMQAIARSCGARVTFDGDSAYAELREVAFPVGAGIDRAREWLNESEALVFAMIDTRERRTKAFGAMLRRLFARLPAGDAAAS